MKADYIDRTLVSSDALTWLEFVQKQKDAPPPGYRFAYKYDDIFDGDNYFTTLIFVRI